MSEFVTASNKDGILVVTLCRPERLNAWNTEMREEVGRLFSQANVDPEVRALVLTGTGDRAFCAGQDLNEAKSFDGPSSELWIEKFRAFYNAARRFEKPFVVALNGLAAGSAFQFALLADQRVGHADAKMGQPEINSGILSMTGFWIIREALGLPRATDLVLTGRLMEAGECFNLGLINHLVDRETVLSKAIEVASDLSSKSAEAFRLNKLRICAVTQAGFDDAYEAARIQHRQAFDKGISQGKMAGFLNAGKAGH